VQNVMSALPHYGSSFYLRERSHPISAHRTRLRDLDVATAPTNLRLEIATFNPTQSCERLRKSGKLCLSFSVVLFVLQNTEAPSPARLQCASN
jgi:hypothetical protein